MSQTMSNIPTLHCHDVICGKRSAHEGNRYFQSLVKELKNEYVMAPKKEKPIFARFIVHQIRSLDPPGRFLKESRINGLYYDIGDKEAITKTRQALREGAPAIEKQLRNSGSIQLKSSKKSFSPITIVSSNQGLNPEVTIQSLPCNSIEPIVVEGHNESFPPTTMTSNQVHNSEISMQFFPCKSIEPITLEGHNKDFQPIAVSPNKVTNPVISMQSFPCDNIEQIPLEKYNGMCNDDIVAIRDSFAGEVSVAGVIPETQLSSGKELHYDMSSNSLSNARNSFREAMGILECVENLNTSHHSYNGLQLNETKEEDMRGNNENNTSSSRRNSRFNMSLSSRRRSSTMSHLLKSILLSESFQNELEGEENVETPYNEQVFSTIHSDDGFKSQLRRVSSVSSYNDTSYQEVFPGQPEESNQNISSLRRNSSPIAPLRSRRSSTNLQNVLRSSLLSYTLEFELDNEEDSGASSDEQMLDTIPSGEGSKCGGVSSCNNVSYQGTFHGQFEADNIVSIDSAAMETPYWSCHDDAQEQHVNAGGDDEDNDDVAQNTKIRYARRRSSLMTFKFAQAILNKK